MRQFIARYWRTVLGLVSNLPALWRALVSFFDWGARVDVVVAHWHELGWVGDLGAFFVSPPYWFFPLAFLGGLGLIYWDTRRRNKKTESGPKPETNSEPSEPEKIPTVPLYEAARRAYDENRETDSAKMARAIDSSPEAIISYFAYALAELIPIYGTPPLSKYVEKIAFKPGSSALRIEFRNEIGYAVSAWADGRENSDNLFVHESSLEEAIKRLRQRSIE